MVTTADSRSYVWKTPRFGKRSIYTSNPPVACDLWFNSDRVLVNTIQLARPSGHRRTDRDCAGSREIACGLTQTWIIFLPDESGTQQISKARKFPSLSRDSSTDFPRASNLRHEFGSGSSDDIPANTAFIRKSLHPMTRGAGGVGTLLSSMLCFHHKQPVNRVPSKHTRRQIACELLIPRPSSQQGSSSPGSPPQPRCREAS